MLKSSVSESTGFQTAMGSYWSIDSDDHPIEDSKDDIPIPVVIADQTEPSELVVNPVSPISHEGNGQITSFGNNTQSGYFELSMNSALVLIKPHANSTPVRDLVRSTLLDQISLLGNGFIASECTLSSEDIQKGELIDVHYKTIARYAMQIPVKQMPIPPSEFRNAFEEDIDVVIRESRIFNAKQALVACDCTPEQLGEAWREADHLIKKFGTGVYCANIQINQKHIYVINGFYLALRRKFTQKLASVYAFVIHWDSRIFSWKFFLSKVIGATNPENAERGSIRKLVHDSYKELGLVHKPDINNNVLHASASPLEGLVERCNWLSRKIREDEYGQILLRKGIPESIVLSWFENNKVEIASLQLYSKDGTELQHVFDSVKDMESFECTELLVRIYDYELFGFVDGTKCSPKQVCNIL